MASKTTPHASPVFFNGTYLSRDEAKLDIEDRGILFADGVYEVVAFFNGKPFCMDAHMRRLRRSLGVVLIDEPALVAQLPQVSETLVAQLSANESGPINAKVYWQITRGPAPRNHAMPQPGSTHPTVLAFARPLSPLPEPGQVPVHTAVTEPDQRWLRNDVKSLMLLPAVLALEAARRRGADHAVMHRDGRVTECESANLFMVRDGALRTHPADTWILHGITRSVIIRLAREAGLVVHEQPFTTTELLNADEAFLSSTTNPVVALGRIDGTSLTGDEPGPVSRRLHALFVEHARAVCV